MSQTIPFPLRTPGLWQPAALSQAIDAAAYALAEINGEVWADMTSERLAQYRYRAKAAADSIDPLPLKHMAYAIELERVQAEHGPGHLGQLQPLDRRGRVWRIVAGIRRAVEMAYGMRPDTMKLVTELAEHDEAERIARKELW